jgi:hypothetical protein
MEFKAKESSTGQKVTLLFYGYVQLKPFGGSDGYSSAPSSRRPGFDPVAVEVEFIVGKVTFGQVFLRVHWCSLVIIIPPVFCCYSSVRLLWKLCTVTSVFSGGKVGRSARQVGPTHNARVDFTTVV